MATTGFASRELYEYRAGAQHGHQRDFLTVGSMGHASSIALGIAMSKPSKQVRQAQRLLSRRGASLWVRIKRKSFCFLIFYFCF